MAQPRKQKADCGKETARTARRVGLVRQGPLSQLEEPDLLALQRAVVDPTLAAPADILALQRRYGNLAVQRPLAQAKGPQEDEAAEKRVETEMKQELPPSRQLPGQDGKHRIPAGEVLQRTNGMESRKREAIREMRRASVRELETRRVHAGETEENPALRKIPPTTPDDSWKQVDYWLWVLKPGIGVFGHYIAVGRESGQFAPPAGQRRGHPTVAIEQYQGRQRYRAKIGGELYWLGWLNEGRGSWVMDNNSGRFGATMGDLEKTKSVLIGAAKVFKAATGQDVQIGKVSRNAVKRWFQTRFRRPWSWFRFRRFYKIGEITHADRTAAFEVIEHT